MDIYGYLKMDIAKVENVKEMMHHKIDDYYELLIDDETEQADIKSLFIDFALSMRTQINLLSLAIDDLNKTNTNLILNISKLPNCSSRFIRTGCRSDSDSFKVEIF